MRRLVDVPGRTTVDVSVRRGPGNHWDAKIDGRDASVVIDDGARPVGVTLDGVRTTLAVSRHGATTWVGTAGSAWPIHDHDPRRSAPPRRRAAAGLGPIRSPMPGTVIVLLVAEGDDVAVGQTVAIVEAMKMEHMLVASAAGVVATVHAREGEPVRLDEPVVTIAAAPHDDEHDHEHEHENRAGRPAQRTRRKRHERLGAERRARDVPQGGASSPRPRSHRMPPSGISIITSRGCGGGDGRPGFFGLVFPERWVGAVPTSRRCAWRSRSSVAPTSRWGSRCPPGSGANPIHQFGTDEQRDRWLPDLVAGRIGRVGLTEPDGGSDAGATCTKARLDGDEWVIDGSKAHHELRDVDDVDHHGHRPHR